MKWTKEKPTELGWYWVAKEGFEKYKACRYLIEVSEYKKRGAKILYCTHGRFPYTFENPDLLWAGPIPEPE